MKITEKDVFFSVRDYDHEGDISKRGIYLHFGMVRILVADNLNEFNKVAMRIHSMMDEIKDNYKGRI